MSPAKPFPKAGGLALKTLFGGTVDTKPAMVLILIGSGLWIVAAVSFAVIKEARGSTGGGRNILKETLAGWRLLRRQRWFQRFLIARVSLLSIELSAPFYLLYVKGLFPDQAGVLGTIIVASGLAAVFSSPVWGRFADLTSRKVMFYSGIMGAITAIVAFGIGHVADTALSAYFIAALFALLGFAEAGG